MENNKKKSKEQFYKELKGISTKEHNLPVYNKLLEQISAEYPNIYSGSEGFFDSPKPEEKEYINNLNSLMNDLQLKNAVFNRQNATPAFGNRVNYKYNDDVYGIDKSPSIPDPKNILTQFLGKFNPIRESVTLSPEERKKVPISIEGPMYSGKDSVPFVYNLI